MRNKINIWKTVAAALLFTSSLHAQADEKLFQDLTFGTPVEQVASSDDYYDCTDEPGFPMLCLDSTQFLGEEFEAALGFNNERLESVAIGAPYSQSLQMKVMGALNRSFTLISLDGETESLDLLLEAKKAKNEKEFSAEIESFEAKHLNSGYLTYRFIEQDSKNIRNKGSAFEAISESPASTRIAEVTIWDDEDGTWVGVTFTIPLLSQQIMVEQAESAPHEDF